MVDSHNRGTPDILVLIIGTPKMVPLILGNPHIKAVVEKPKDQPAASPEVAPAPPQTDAAGLPGLCRV